MTEWLKNVVGMTNNDFDKFPMFKYFDGEALFLYRDTGYRELESDLQIPIGLARKILLLRNCSEINHKSRFQDWTTETVGGFIRETVNISDEDIDNICRLITERCIDGIVFASYSNSTEMQNDIHEGNEFGIIYRKVFARRDKLIEERFAHVQSDSEISPVPTDKRITSPGKNVAEFQNQSLISENLLDSNCIPCTSETLLELDSEVQETKVNFPNYIDKASGNNTLCFNSLQEEKLSVQESNTCISNIIPSNQPLDQNISTNGGKCDILSQMDLGLQTEPLHESKISFPESTTVELEENERVQNELVRISGSSPLQLSRNVRILTSPYLENSLELDQDTNQIDINGLTRDMQYSDKIVQCEDNDTLYQFNSRLDAPKNVKDQNKNNSPSGLDEQWQSFFTKSLRLYPVVENHDNDVNCKLNIIHCNWTKPNDLEKRLLFIVLSAVNDFTCDGSRKTIWDKIGKNMASWYQYLSDADKSIFETNKQKDDCLLYKGKPISLPKAPLKMRFMMEKDVDEMLKYRNIFMLIDKNLLTPTTEGYCTNLVNPDNVKHKTIYTFGFDSSQKYWLFDPSDYAYGFRLKQIHIASCGGVGMVNEYQKIERLEGKEEINDSMIQHQSSHENLELTIQRCREFKADDTAVQYHERWVMSTVEHDGAVSYRCFEFKFVTDSVLIKGLVWLSRFINNETIRFACGCLNARKNGTIMFGIGDTQSKRYLHGEVVGFPITGFERDVRMELTESLRLGIKHCFESHHQRVALKCIGNPVFVEVIADLPSCKKFVVEIDIEPSSHFCKDECFKVNRSKLPNLGNIKKIEKEFTCFVREDTGTVQKVKQELDLFVRTELRDIIRKREEDEKQNLNTDLYEQSELPMDKLRKRLCNGSDKFDQSVWPILILIKPTDKQRHTIQWIRSFKFIKHFTFHAVFDFDDCSNKDGLCSCLRNEEKSILLDEEIFKEFSGRKYELATKLGMPHEMKTVWIFSNGRSDLRPPKFHLNTTDWTNVYSAGIRDAVIFFSQKEIIPPGRAVVIMLLLSTDFDGLTETFREIVVRFGWNQIIVVTVDDILERFIQEFKEMEDNIRKCSVYGKGLTWEHVNSTFLEIAGCEEESTIHIMTSSGVSVSADEKFVETLSEIHILSSKQCENKKFKTRQERSRFALEKEIQFYKGNKVDWFNFHFQDQVLKRHCFDRLKRTIADILRTTPTSHRQNRQNKIISTIVIQHEPGAGGSTLARHVLWEFRALYRCAIVKKITERTAKNILSFWQYKENYYSKPLLLLIDDLQCSEFSFEDLMRQIYIEYRSNFVKEGLVCCFLLCQREEQITELSSFNSPTYSNTGDVIEHLKQQLTSEEVDWMHEKYEKMESTESEYKPEYLISFMILREGFNQDYIKNTIKRFLTQLDFRSNEFELLEYTSLLSSYVPTSKRGPSAFIPLECCDDIMGLRTTKTLYWEQTMSDVLKIFLIIEPKETASGMQIRMAHPALAEAVLSEILENKSLSLGALTLRFLDSSIIQSQTHARGMIIDFTKEMLKRRLKEEYNDSRTTLFSPLIEEICKKESWTVAVDVLKRGLDKFKDSYIAQALARLCVKYKDFDNAEIWARQAIEMSVNNTTACSFSHYTLATVLEDKFKHDTKALDKINPQDAVQYISLILDALDHFLEASRLKVGTEGHLLYPIQGVIKTIITCAKFISNHVRFSNYVDIKKYLTCSEFSPEEINDVWEKFRPKFLALINHGERAFAKFEECLCFNTTFYAHDSTVSTNKKSREHRLYRNLQFKYPDLFNDFKFFFGATPEECPKSQMPEVMNNWHRRRLLQLGGTTYMNICNILRQIRKRSNQFSAADAVQRCIEIKDHLIKITDRQSKDLANLVSVNIVLGLLGGRNRDSADNILEYCKQIIKMKRGYEDIAHFFICILLWPSNNIDIVYDDDLFYDSLKYLHLDRETKHGRSRVANYPVMKEEKNITQATTQFFLSKGRGFNSICHRFDIFFREQPETEFDNTIWANQTLKNNLQRLKGQLKICKGKCHIRMINEKTSPFDDRYIEIRKIRSGKKEFLSEEDVHFYLGFSIAGPIAYNVQPARYETELVLAVEPQVQDKVEEYLERSQESLQQTLNKISDLKSKKKNGRRISARDVSY